MIENVKTWLKKRFFAAEVPEREAEKTAAHTLARPKPVPAPKPAAGPAAKPARTKWPAKPVVESNGPGKNVLIRNKYVREDTGTHETLKILDDSMLDSGEETGIDPYNTGSFDRSKNWNNRFRRK